MKGPTWRLLALLRPQAGRVALGASLLVATLLAGLGLMSTSAWLISTAALRPSIAALGVAIVGVRFFGISRGVVRYLERVVSHDVTLRLLSRIRVRVYQALVPLAPARLMEQRSGDLLARVMSDVETLEHLYVRVVGPTVAAVIVAAVVTGALAVFAPRLAWPACGGLVAAGLVAPVLARATGRGSGRRLVQLRARLQAEAVDGVQGSADLVAFGRAPDHAARLASTADEVARAEVVSARSSALGSALSSLSADLAVVSLLVLAIPLVGIGTLDGVNLAVTVLATLAAFEAVTSLPAAWQGLSATRTAASRLFEFVDTQPTVIRPLEVCAVPPASAIEIRRLSFTYPGQPEPALRDVDLGLQPGKVVALVGASGSGKSTLAHLLLRFWEVPSGSILVGGRDVCRLADDDVRALIAFASQRVHLFTGTVRENLCLASPDATDDELWGALQRARLDAFVRSQPDGLDTWIGEQGLTLAGGERQRLALARAILREAPFLVLDEPTANLDAVAEREVLGEIRRLGSRRGVLLVTHRLAGLEVADEIVMLDRGRVVARGSYRDLAATEGPFRRMLRQQRAEMSTPTPFLT